jgi:hypothetical protein
MNIRAGQRLSISKKNPRAVFWGGEFAPAPGRHFLRKNTAASENGYRGAMRSEKTKKERPGRQVR